MNSFSQKFASRILFLNVDVDKFPTEKEFPDRVGVNGVPAFKFFQGDKLLWFKEGPFTENNLNTLLKP